MKRNLLVWSTRLKDSIATNSQYDSQYNGVSMIDKRTAPISGGFYIRYSCLTAWQPSVVWRAEAASGEELVFH